MNTSSFLMPQPRRSLTYLNSELDPDECAKFKIVICSATACTKKRRALGMDDFATYGALYEKKEGDNAPNVQVEECSCLGACKNAPIVAVEHEDYDGTVGLEGMTDSEFEKSMFYGVSYEDDVDRVWSSVRNAIIVMAEMEDEDEDE